MEKKQISALIPDPFRTQLIEAGKNAGCEKTVDELAVVSAHINTIRAQCAAAFPHLFKDAPYGNAA